MRKVYSQYKFFGGFGLLIALNALAGLGTYKLIFDSNINYRVVDLINDSDAQYAYLVIIGLQILFLVLFSTQNKFIISDQNEITFVNPLLPFIQRKKTWDSYDYWVTVDESSQGGTYEAVWLIKNGRIKGRF